MRGKLVVFEGIDGAGKATQIKLAAAKLGQAGIRFAIFSFPRHGQPAAYFADRYLAADSPYGQPAAVNPYCASLFFALDRYDASFVLKQMLADGVLLIADRYLASNIGYQGGKIEDDTERASYVEWLMNLEFNLLGIPRPDLNIIFRLPPEAAAQRIIKRGREEEVSIGYLQKAQLAYLWAAKHYPQDFRVIKCFTDERELTPEEVSQQVWEIFENEIL
jgi:dTMP kinase